MKTENSITEQEISILLGEKDLAIFFLRKKVKLLIDELQEIKVELQKKNQE